MWRHSSARHFYIPALVLGSLFLFPALLSAQDDGCPITVTALNGTATSGGGTLTVGSALAKGDTVRTGNGSGLELNVGGAVLKVGARSVLMVDVSYCPDPTSRSVRLKLLSGSIWAKGNASAPKLDISTEKFMATVGTSTLAVNARYLDTTFTLAQESQEISTRDWKDTVDVLHYTFPFKGEVNTVFAIAGNVMVLPWGGRGAMLKQGNQAIYGYDESFISSKPQPIKQEELLFDAAGSYRGM